MPDRFKGYDVLAKRDSLSWNDKTREVVDARISVTEDAQALSPARLATLRRLVERIAPQPQGRAPANTLALLTRRIAEDDGPGYRLASMPRFRAAWEQGLDAIDAEARARHRRGFPELDDNEADELLRAVSRGDVSADAWKALSPTDFWNQHAVKDVVTAHWSHPSLWSAMGFGGPASPRGYVRLEANRRDPWEAEED